MKAMLLAAGFGTRLRPLTDSIPKCLVPVKGKPLLQIWLEQLTDAGIGHFLVNTHYLADKVHGFVGNSQWHSHIRLFHEPKLLGTAGTLLANLDFFAGEDGLIAHADNYCLPDFKDFIAAHKARPSHCLMTLMTFRTTNPSQCGIVTIDEGNIVTAFHEKVANPPGNLANAAIYIFSAELLNMLRKLGPEINDISTQIIGSYVGSIYAYHTDKVMIDIGTPENYALANWVT